MKYNRSINCFPDKNCEECCKVKLRDTLGLYGKFLRRWNGVDTPHNFYLGCDKCQSKQKIRLIYTKINNRLSGYFKEYYETKVKLDALCPCGSGKKFKKCHYQRGGNEYGSVQYNLIGKENKIKSEQILVFTNQLRTKKLLIKEEKIGICIMYHQDGTQALAIDFINNKIIGPEDGSKQTDLKQYQKYKNNGEFENDEIEFLILVANSGILTLESKCFCECNSDIKNCEKMEKARIYIPSRDTLENDIFVKELLLNDWDENQKTNYYRK